MEVHVNFRGRKPVPQHVDIGMERENKVTVLCFEGLPKMEGSTAYLHIDLGDNSDVIEIVDGQADVKRTLTQFTGSVEAFVEVLGANDRVWHSQIMELSVGRLPILGEKIEQEYPTAFEQALAQTAADKAAAAKSAADAAATAAGIVTEEAARQDAEGKRVAAETARGQAEKTRAEHERLRASAESERVKAENARVTAEENREKAEAAREQEVADALSSVAGVENTVQANERQRVLAERTRAAQEQARQSAEQSRVEAERAREQAEQRRETAETSRAEAERQRESMETSRQTAETTRNAAENGRAKAEKARETAESQRQQAETARADAESKRVQAEQGRVTAEQGRVAAETQREEAMAQHAEKIAELESEVAKKAQIDDTTVSDAAPWSSQHIVDVLCPPLEESGNPVVCYPVANSNLDIVASWEPTQEGSGEPYPAGGGPNLLDVSQCTPAPITSAYGLTVTVDGTGLIKLSGTPTVKVEAQRATFRILFTNQVISVENYKAKAFVVKGTVTGIKTIASDKSIVIITPLAPDTPVDIQFRLMYYVGDEPTAYAPYANIRPIHGRTQVSVERCGENLLNIAPFTKLTKSGVTYEYVANGGMRISGTATANVDSPTFAVGHLPPGKYYGLDMGTGIDASIVVQRNGSNLWLNAKGQFEILAGDVIKYWYLIANNGVTLDKTVYPYIVPGTSAPAEYAPYSGSTTTLALPSTIYGGEVGADGEGQETWKLLTLDGTENWSVSGKYLDNKSDWYYVSSQIPGAVNKEPMKDNDICSHFPHADVANNNAVKGCAIVWGAIRVRWGDTIPEDADEWNFFLSAQYAAGTPVQVAYKLATPVPFTATGGDTIKALSGTNTVLTDADAVAVKGRADPIRIIQQLQAASTASAQALADVERAVTDI